jgi:5-methylcytosine-specific restriction endonuclease McrBC GTP-binding regulatory subunit McrB
VSEFLWNLSKDKNVANYVSVEKSVKIVRYNYVFYGKMYQNLKRTFLKFQSIKLNVKDSHSSLGIPWSKYEQNEHNTCPSLSSTPLFNGKT